MSLSGRIQVLSAMVGVVGALVVVPAALAKTIVPTQLGDEPLTGSCTKQKCTLREAVNEANLTAEPDVIELRGGKTYPLTVVGTGEDTSVFGDLDVLYPLTIKSDGKARATINAKGLDRVIDTYNLAGELKLSRLTIRGGNSGGVAGGGVLIRSGELLVDRSVVLGNTSTPTGSGGGIAVVGGAQATIKRSTLSSNSGEGGGLAVGPSSSAEVLSSTVSDNEAQGNGGGIFVGLGGSATLDVINSTIAGNEAGSSGGGIISATGAPINIQSSTIARNTANLSNTGQEGGGVAEASNGPIEIANTIIADNEVAGTGIGPDCGFPGFAVYAVTVPGSTNLVSDDERCGGLALSPNILAPNPKLGPLSDNGGPTKTVALRKSSPAVNAAGSGPRSDQRGVKRKNPDIGAYEYVKKKRKR